MKKFLLVLLAALLCAGAVFAEEAASEATPSPTPVPEMIAQPTGDATRRPTQTATPRPADAPLPEDVFFGNAVEIARRMGMLMDSGVYYDYCNVSGATKALWDEVARGDHTMPVRVFSLTGDALRYGLTGGDPESSPWFDLTRADLRRDMVSTLPDMMYIGMASEKVSLCRSLARYKVFAADIPEGCGLLVMQYGEGTPIVLPWYTEGGAVSISAFFMPDEELEGCQTAEDVSKWFASLGMPVVPFEEVTIE